MGDAEEGAEFQLLQRYEALVQELESLLQTGLKRYEPRVLKLLEASASHQVCSQSRYEPLFLLLYTAHRLAGAPANALQLARALLENTDLDARTIVERSLQIAADVCIYTNNNLVIETLDVGQETD